MVELCSTAPLDAALANLAAPSEDPRARWNKAAIAARLFGEPDEPPRIGRFTVLDRIGGGGMGEVFRARDDELDRIVAIKVMAGRTSAAALERFSREGRALARLSHANIVQVHEVGQHDGAMFIAMEHVAGRTLGAWMRDEPPRGWRETVGVLLEAGRGLAAAHAAGLVHRDFKPDNVMLGDDGRPRVLDFGLARAAGPDEAIDRTHDSGVVTPSTADPRVESRVTVTGTMLGTPAYMAPEQHDGELASAASDQFAFCVTLYESLYGGRPFTGNTRAEIRRAIEQGIVAPGVARRGPIPRGLRQIVVRGLAARAESRWPSMDALLDALARRLHRRRARWVGGLLGLGLCALGLGLWRQADVAGRCNGVGERLDGIWDAAAREQLSVRFAATGHSQAATTWARIEPRIGAYVDAWVAAVTASCEATMVDGAQPVDTMELRGACFDRRHSELVALLEVLGAANGTVVERAHDIVAGLRPIASCDDIEGLRADVPPPEDPATAAEVVAVRERLAKAHALLKGGLYAEGAGLAAELTDTAESLAYAPLLAEALAERGWAQELTAHYPEAAEDLERAYVLATEQEHFDVATTTATWLTWVVGYRLARYEQGLQWGTTALALGRRARADADDEAAARGVLSTVLQQTQRLDEALEQLHAALALREAAFGPDSARVAQTLGNLGYLLWTMHRGPEARVYLERAIAIKEVELGPTHPELIRPLTTLGALVRAHGELDASLAFQRRSLAIGEVSLGPAHPQVAGSIAAIGLTLQAKGELDAAHEHFTRALAIFEAALPEGDVNLAIPHTNLAMLALERERFAEALPHARKTLALREAVMVPTNPAIALAAGVVGLALHGMGDGAAAKPMLDRCITGLQQGARPTTVGLSPYLDARAAIALAEGATAEALALAQRAVEIAEANDPPTAGQYRFTLARAMRADKRTSAEARALAQRARTELVAADATPKQIAEIDAWLRANPQSAAGR